MANIEDEECDIILYRVQTKTTKTIRMRTSGVLRLGRGMANDFVLDFTGVSVFHCELYLRPSPEGPGHKPILCIKDTSKNGTAIRPSSFSNRNTEAPASGLWEHLEPHVVRVMEHGWEMMVPARSQKEKMQLPEAWRTLMVFIGEKPASLNAANDPDKLPVVATRGALALKPIAPAFGQLPDIPKEAIRPPAEAIVGEAAAAAKKSKKDKKDKHRGESATSDERKDKKAKKDKKEKKGKKLPAGPVSLLGCTLHGDDAGVAAVTAGLDVCAISDDDHDDVVLVGSSSAKGPSLPASSLESLAEALAAAINEANRGDGSKELGPESRRAVPEESSPRAGSNTRAAYDFPRDPANPLDQAHNFKAYQELFEHAARRKQEHQAKKLRKKAQEKLDRKKLKKQKKKQKKKEKRHKNKKKKGKKAASSSSSGSSSSSSSSSDTDKTLGTDSSSEESAKWDHRGYLYRSPSPCRLRTEGAMAKTRKGAWRSRAGGVYLPPLEEDLATKMGDPNVVSTTDRAQFTPSPSPARYLYPEELKEREDRQLRRSPSYNREHDEPSPLRTRPASATRDQKGKDKNKKEKKKDKKKDKKDKKKRGGSSSSGVPDRKKKRRRTDSKAGSNSFDDKERASPNYELEPTAVSKAEILGIPRASLAVAEASLEAWDPAGPRDASMIPEEGPSFASLLANLKKRRKGAATAKDDRDEDKEELVEAKAKVKATAEEKNEDVGKDDAKSASESDSSSDGDSQEEEDSGEDSEEEKEEEKEKEDSDPCKADDSDFEEGKSESPASDADAAAFGTAMPDNDSSDGELDMDEEETHPIPTGNESKSASKKKKKLKVADKKKAPTCDVKKRVKKSKGKGSL
mmetsp:Transcript_13004/g.28883  ORF Transcript_13004/g.28883 Transcript_13004/m.28883 type:complete len:857 (-) Transcript_13004:170-2740(-)